MRHGITISSRFNKTGSYVFIMVAVHQNIDLKKAQMMHKMSKFYCVVLWVKRLLVLILSLMYYLCYVCIVNIYLSFVDELLLTKSIVPFNLVISLGNLNCTVLPKFHKKVNIFKTRMSDQSNKINVSKAEIQNLSTLQKVFTSLTQIFEIWDSMKLTT